MKIKQFYNLKRAKINGDIMINLIISNKIIIKTNFCDTLINLYNKSNKQNSLEYLLIFIYLVWEYENDLSFSLIRKGLKYKSIFHSVIFDCISYKSFDLSGIKYII